ncbi:MAG: cupin domain-containing protein [Chloroflexi bacterium]|nr:cupin domain-containing protein [Chloroflexota bacterium]
MHETSQGRDRPPGQTSGSPQRPPHNLAKPITVVNLAQETSTLHQEPAWQHGDRNARTLVKEPDLRVVLTTLKRGGVLREHESPGTAAVQTVSGHLRLQIEGQTIDLPAGQMVMLAPDMRHDVEALEDSAFTITIAWKAGMRDEA